MFQLLGIYYFIYLNSTNKFINYSTKGSALNHICAIHTQNLCKSPLQILTVLAPRHFLPFILITCPGQGRHRAHCASVVHDMSINYNARKRRRRICIQLQTKLKNIYYRIFMVAYILKNMIQ